ncbi:MAG: HDOD domain-containing protein [Planctomycetota bacterium]|jgi:putative nucleotidyltransferase with HDIG domain
MPDRDADISVAQQVELAIRGLDSLSILPCVAAQFLLQLSQTQTSTAALAEIIESDPALTAKIFSLMYEQGLNFSKENCSIRHAAEKLPVHLVRDAFFSVNVASEFDSNIAPSGKELILHSLAVACCAKAIAETTSPKVNSHLAYSAGLLHNIGNLALHQVMPKSFARIVEEAKSKRTSISSIERKQLGLDYTILGKRLAQKWHLPNEIVLAIWLHRNDADTLYENMPEARMAQIVRSADSIAYQSGLDESGSYDSGGSTEQIAQSLAIYPEQLEQIGRELPEQVAEKSKILGLDLPKPEASYRDIVHSAAAQLARDNSKLSSENRRLQTASSHFDFVKEFLLSINSDSSPIDIAENFAAGFQKFYQTGMVCLYPVPPSGSETLEAVVVETLAQTKTVILNAPSETPTIPKAIANSFAILSAGEHVDWLFEQLDVDFELSQTKLLPLLSGRKAVGVMVFELRYPADAELYREQLRIVTSTAGAILDIAFASEQRQRFAERFAELLSKPKDTQQPFVKDDSFGALAEMAAGAAHELNNPLSVISGRAQLLAGAESDAEKKRVLEQIQENARELSAILDDLMSFAKPQQPRPTPIDVKQMLDEALQLSSMKMNAEHINAQIEVAEDVESVFVDSGQVVSALANVIYNSLESYTEKMGPVKITAADDKSGSSVKVQISDLGCGMDAETLQKATWPFFCGRAAGRKRGMGLAQAARLIQLNNGSLDIASEPGRGTTVTILLRRADR